MILRDLFGYERLASTRLVALFGLLGVWTAVIGALLLFRPWSAWTVVLGLFLMLSLVALGWWFLPRTGTIPVETESITTEPIGLGEGLAVILFFVLFIWGEKLLWSARIGASVINPWQVIPGNYILVFAAATAVVGFLLFSRLRVSTILFLLMLHTFLLHSYLPMTQQFFYGADGWRHAGYVSNILSGEPLVQAELSSPAGIGARLGVLTYGQFWSFLALLQKVADWSLPGIIAWTMPIVWALIFPLLTFDIASSLSLGRRGALLAVWLSSLPFALQVAGAFTLPVNLGFLWWLLAIALLLRRALRPHRGQVYVLAVIGLLAIFSYSLFALLFFLAWMMAEIGLAVHHRSASIYYISAAVAAVLGSLVIPAVELVTHYSQLAPINWLQAMQQLVGNFSGWYLASGPRPHTIAAGNILFNQIPLQNFVVNFLTASRWWLVVVAVLFWIGVKAGWWRILRSHRPGEWFLTVFTVSMFGSYIISRYFLGGEHIFARRLDVVLAWLAVLLLAMTLVHVIDWLFLHRVRFSLLVTAFVLFGTLAITASYTLGPNTDAVSVDTYQAMQYVWSAEKLSAKHCVIAPTFPLVALEAISARHIIGGGFPIDQLFAQPELTKTWVGFHNPPTTPWWTTALVATKAKQCWLLIEKKRSIQGGTKVGQFGTLVLWKSN